MPIGVRARARATTCSTSRPAWSPPRDDPQGRPTVVDLVPAEPRVFPVGRLDVDTEGLLLLTNDGELTHRLTHPSLRRREGVPGRGRGRAVAGPRCAACARASSSTTASPRRPRPSLVGARRWSASPSTRAATARSGACARRSATRCVRLVRTRIGPLADRRLAPGDVAGARPSTRCARSNGRSASRPADGRRRPPGRGPRSVASPPMPAAVRALRGATTVDADDPEQIAERVVALLEEMFERNGVDHDDLISILFTATDDIRSTFPATGGPHHRAGRRAAALRPGDLDVDGRACPAASGCWSTSTPSGPATELHHVYLEGAVGLRDDLPE